MSSSRKSLRRNKRKTRSPQAGPESTDVQQSEAYNWLDVPIHDRITAAYHIGRLINLLEWHFQHALFFGSAYDEAIIDEALGRLIANTYHFVRIPPNHLEAAIDDVRREWRDWLYSESAGESINESYRSESFGGEWINPVERRHELVKHWVQPLVDKLVNNFWGDLSAPEKWALELGRCVDQGIRRKDVYRFFEEETIFKGESQDTDEFNGQSNWWLNTESEVVRRSFVTGELPADPAWRHTLQQLVEKLGSAEACTTIVTALKESGQDQKDAILQTVDLLDRRILEHLGARSDAASASNFPNMLSPINVSATESTIPSKHLSRVMTKAEAARYHAGEKVANPTTYFDRLIEQGQLTPPIGSGQRWQFDVRDFPENVRATILCSESSES